MNPKPQMMRMIRKRMKRIIYCLMALWAAFAAQARAAAQPTATYSAELNASALQQGQTAVIAVVVDIATGLHTQSHEPLNQDFIPFQVKPDANSAVQFLDPVYPPAKIEDFPGLGKESVYTGRVIVYLPMRINANASAGATTLGGKLIWQACNDKACFAPEGLRGDRTFSLSTQIVPASQTVTPNDPSLFSGFDASVFAKGAAPATPPSVGTVIGFFGSTFTLGVTDRWLALAVALAVGVLFNLVPCVLPVVPLKAIGFLEVSRHNRAKCFFLGLVFSAGVVACFVALAMLILVWHRFAWGQQFSSGWFIWVITALLLLFALGMFGAFDVVLPESVYRVTLTHESVTGNFLFGIFTAVLSTPCTAPMFAGLLTWALTEPPALGVAAVITVGVGMALPYLVLSAFPGLVRWVPHTGPWSLVLKQMMGFLLIAGAVYFGAGRLISGSRFIWAVFAVVVVAMIFLIIRTIQLAPRRGPVIGSLLSAAAVVAIALDITLRLTGGLDWQPYSPDALAAARADGRPVLVEFTANWCGNCLALEASVFRDPQIARAVKQKNVLLLRADMTDAPQSSWDLVNRLNPGGGIPLTAIYGPHSDEPLKLTSLFTTQNLLDALGRAVGKV
jgi:thiol:disulfide interchange protein DsbD